MIEWVVSCDQPFQEVEHPEFRALLGYVHHCSTTLKIPSADTVQRRVMKIGQTMEDELREFFEVKLIFFEAIYSKQCMQKLESLVSISLDAWSSSNGYAFIAIVAHYITNDGKLGESLPVFLPYSDLQFFFP